MSGRVGNLLTQYSYDPFGNTAVTGAASGNEFQYIGRENDLNGLYYLHARYYSPSAMRFISEDPLGFGGEDVNLHAYIRNSPTNLTDPTGNSIGPQDCIFGAALDISFNIFADWYTGRKITTSNVLGYAAEGCTAGIIGAALGEFVLEPLIEWAAPYVARVFADELATAANATVGDAGAAASPFKILNPEFVPDARAVLQNIVNDVNANLAANPALAQLALSRAEIAASKIPGISPLSYGNALEGLVGKVVSDKFGSILEYTGRGAGPDFVGVGSAAGEFFELTSPRAIAAHMARPYGPWLDFVTYIRPARFTGF